MPAVSRSIAILIASRAVFGIESVFDTHENVVGVEEPKGNIRAYDSFYVNLDKLNYNNSNRYERSRACYVKDHCMIRTILLWK